MTTTGPFGFTDVDEFMATYGSRDLTAAISADQPGRIASGERYALAALEARRVCDLDPANNGVVYKRVARDMALFHVLEKVDRIGILAPREGPGGIRLPMHNSNDPDHADGAVFAFFAAEPTVLHVLRAGYTVHDVERSRSPIPQPCDWQLTGCSDGPKSAYCRARCGQYVILYATCFGCWTELVPDDFDDDGGIG